MAHTSVVSKCGEIICVQRAWQASIMAAFNRTVVLATLGAGCRRPTVVGRQFCWGVAKRDGLARL
ncbi:hypothetical protein BRW65_07570 [Mycobacterium paraffinicum]|uniref:Uncharacterized protein n=1 Tax=Mycobacterium paraffinicum TaxID=53378 RepID=A0A1Q4HXZ1_9MYCO|nr:hypothetical protein BRW65_07570 [Mycobacterium paraffinicum]